MATKSLWGRLTDNIKASYAHPIRFPGAFGNGYGGNYLGLWGANSALSYTATMDDAQSNSIVAATLGWIGRTYPEAPIRVVKETSKGEEPVPGHPLAALLKRPNPYYSGAQMWTPLLMSYVLDGNAYLLVERTNGGDVLALWYVPHWTMEPRWPADGSAFISHYDYKVDGIVTRYDVADVVHLPNGRDPRNMRKGLSQLKAALREIYTDNEITRYESAMLRNRGTPGAFISPGSPDGTITPEEAAFVSQQYLERTTGENQGKPIVSLAAIKVDTPSFSPSEMNLRQMRWTPEERISALIGIPAIVIGLGAGLEHATFANYQQAREAAYESFLMPVQALIDEELTTQLLPNFTNATDLRVAHDYTKVRVLQPDANLLATRAFDGFSKGVYDRAHTMKMIGEDPQPGDEGVYFLPRGGSFSDGTIAEPISVQTTPVDTEPGAAASPPTNGKKPTADARAAVHA